MKSINSLLGDLEKEFDARFPTDEGLDYMMRPHIKSFIKARERRLISLIVEEINRLQFEVIGRWEPNENGMYSRGLEDLKQFIITPNEEKA